MTSFSPVSDSLNTSSLCCSFLQITEELEQVKAQMDERGTNMTDAGMNVQEILSSIVKDILWYPCPMPSHNFSPLVNRVLAADDDLIFVLFSQLLLYELNKL